MYMNQLNVTIARAGINYSVFVDGHMVYTFASEEGAYAYVDELQGRV